MLKPSNQRIKDALATIANKLEVGENNNKSIDMNGEIATQLERIADGMKNWNDNSGGGGSSGGGSF